MELKYQLPSDPSVYVDLLDDEDVRVMFDEVRSRARALSRLPPAPPWHWNLCVYLWHWGFPGSDRFFGSDRNMGSEEGRTSLACWRLYCAVSPVLALDVLSRGLLLWRGSCLKGVQRGSA